MSNHNDMGVPSSLVEVDIAALMRFLFILFAYVWWAVIIVNFGLLDEQNSREIQIISFPLTVVGLALACCFHLSLSIVRYGFSTLFFSGLLVCGALA